MRTNDEQGCVFHQLKITLIQRLTSKSTKFRAVTVARRQTILLLEINRQTQKVLSLSRDWGLFWPINPLNQQWIWFIVDQKFVDTHFPKDSISKHGLLQTFNVE